MQRQSSDGPRQRGTLQASGPNRLFNPGPFAPPPPCKKTRCRLLVTTSVVPSGAGFSPSMARWRRLGSRVPATAVRASDGATDNNTLQQRQQHRWRRWMWQSCLHLINSGDCVPRRLCSDVSHCLSHPTPCDGCCVLSRRHWCHAATPEVSSSYQPSCRASAGWAVAPAR